MNPSFGLKKKGYYLYYYKVPSILRPSHSVAEQKLVPHLPEAADPDWLMKRTIAGISAAGKY
jgi:hypothetical protein